jgi:hypothetical protein
MRRGIAAGFGALPAVSVAVAISALVAACTSNGYITLNGDIEVTISGLQNPADLQGTLRNDGLPVNVTFSGHARSPCQAYLASPAVMNAIVRFTSKSEVFLVINPSALPRGAGVEIEVEPQQGSYRLPPWPTTGNGPQTHARGGVEVSVGLVSASQQCTW